MFIQRVRVRFEKRGELRAISHLDLMRAFERAIRRTGLPLRMSEGYNPRPRISFPVPLGVGMEGLDEIMEFDLADWVFPGEIERRLREQMPDGLKIVSLDPADPQKAAQGAAATYRVTPRLAERDDGRLGAAALRELMERDDVPVRRVRKGREKVVNIRPFVLSVSRDGEDILFRFKTGPEGSARPEEVLGALGFDALSCRADFAITRTEVRLAS